MASTLKTSTLPSSGWGPVDTVTRPSLLHRVRALAERLSAAAGQADEAGEIAPESLALLHRSGLAMAPFPAALGGDDLGMAERQGDLCALLILLGAADLSIARLVEGHINAVLLVCRYGSAAQQAVLAEAVEAGGFSAVWGADDARGLTVEAVASGWRLVGRKILASGAGFVTHPVVTARTDAGQVMLLPTLARGERADLSAWTPQGMRSSATGAVDLSGLVLTEQQFLGHPGDFMRQPHFSGGAWRFCAVHLGAMERLVDLFRHELRAKGREGDPYQLQRVAQCVAAAATTRFWVEAAARRLGDEADPDGIVAFVNLTRLVTERSALDIVEAVHRGVGLGAFMRPQPIERVARDLATYLRQPVPDLAMADAARAILASDRPTGSLWRRVPG